MQWSIGKQIGRRGAGLGNEIFPWAKAYLGARALGIRHIHPPWATNPRKYHHDLGGNLAQSAFYYTMLASPGTEITTSSYANSGIVDYFEATKQLLSGGRTTHQIVKHSSGMLGGYLAIRRARPFLRSQLLGNSSAVVASEVINDLDQRCVRIGVHIRGGDFTEQSTIIANSFNQRLPLDWYRDSVMSLVASLDVPFKIILATDGKTPEMIDALTVNGIKPTIPGKSSIEDLAILANCDVIVSSVSSFSLLAIFLSNAPYIWHRDQLHEAGGWLSIWGHEQGIGGDSTRRAMLNVEANAKSLSGSSFERGIPVGERPQWSAPLLDRIRNRAIARERSRDLIYFGVARGDNR